MWAHTGQSPETCPPLSNAALPGHTSRLRCCGQGLRRQLLRGLAADQASWHRLRGCCCRRRAPQQRRQRRAAGSSGAMSCLASAARPLSRKARRCVEASTEPHGQGRADGAAEGGGSTGNAGGHLRRPGRGSGCCAAKHLGRPGRGGHGTAENLGRPWRGSGRGAAEQPRRPRGHGPEVLRRSRSRAPQETEHRRHVASERTRGWGNGRSCNGERKSP